MITVLIVDDQALVRDGFRMILDEQHDITVVGEAADGQQAIEQAQMLEPDIIVMDIRMPTMNGLDAIRHLMARRGARWRILVLTTFDLDEYVYDAMKAGASGFLLKDVPRRQLIEAVRTVAEGDALLAPAITCRLVERFVQSPPPTTGIPDQLHHLTERELDVLRLVARGLSNAEIADRLTLGQNTIKTHLGHVLDKLAARDRTQAVVAAYETGLVQPGQG